VIKHDLQTPQRERVLTTFSQCKPGAYSHPTCPDEKPALGFLIRGTDLRGVEGGHLPPRPQQGRVQVKRIMLAVLAALSLGVGAAEAASATQHPLTHKPNYYNWLSGGGG
jgi:hypothetical protein